MKPLLVLPVILLFLSSCYKGNKQEELRVVGMRPIYATNDDWKSITVTEGIPLQNLGKFYTKGNFIYAVQKGKGIHIINNTDPTSPSNIKFIEVTGISDLTIRGDILYADNIKDLVAIDISDLENVHVVQRLEGQYTNGEFLSPPDYQGYFECVDLDKGVPIAWEQANLVNPKCQK